MYYSLEKTAEILEMNPGDVNKLREQGKLRAFRDGAVWKFRKEDVEKYLTDMIKARSANAASSLDADLLSGESDEEGPTMLADSAAFDSMISDAGDAGIVASLGVDDDEDLKIVEDESEFALAEESTPLTDEHSALVEDSEPNASVSSSSAVDLAANASDDDMLHLGSDSGLSLLDDPDVEGSDVALGGDDDLVLGGGSSSGSGSGLDLTGDSGLALLGDSDGDFQLDDRISDEIKSEALESDEPDVFELADEDAPKDNVLNLANNVEADAPTELVNVEDSIFDLAGETSQGTESTDDDASSESASQFITVDDANPFLTDVESSTLENDPLAVEQSGDSATDDVFAVADSTPAASSDPFGGISATTSPDSSEFLNVADSSDAFGGFDSNTQGSVNFDSASAESDDFASDVASETTGFAPAPASTNFTGKDMIILVPCLLLLILASVGAWELCRTIWSYQEGSFDFGGPVLEMIAKMVKLI